MNLTVEAILLFVVGVGLGAGAVFVLLRSRLLVERGRMEQAEQLLEGERTRGRQEVERQRETYERLLQDMRMTEDKVKTAFTALATSVLDKNTERFKESAEKDLRQIKTEGTADLDTRVKVFETAVDELKLRLRDANDRITGFEKERVEIYTRLETQMKQMNEQEQRLISETDRLKSALTTSSSVRGRWGELVLRNILQSSELMQHIDYIEQAGTRTSEGDDLKPDFVVKLPNAGQHLVIDAKTSLYESYLEGEQVRTESERRLIHAEFAKKIRKRVQDLSSKEYQKNVSESVPYVIMFVPGEAAIRAAFDADGEMFQYAMERKVFIASPATIIPLLMLIANAWRQFKMSTQAAELSKVVEQIGDRLNLFVDRLGKVQKGLETATKSWNEAIDKSWYGQQSIMRSIDKARELGAQIPELAAVEAVQLSPRAIEGLADGQDANHNSAREITDVSDIEVGISETIAAEGGEMQGSVTTTLGAEATASTKRKRRSKKTSDATTELALVTEDQSAESTTTAASAEDEIAPQA